MQVPVDMSRFVQGQASNDVQMIHEPITNRDVQYNSSQGTLLPAPRITQLQIPNNEVAYFGRDASPPAVVPDDILVSQAAARFNQGRQREPSHFSEESYNVRHHFQHRNLAVFSHSELEAIKNANINLIWNNSH